MIFVILGISVLVASFLIALVSLIREQSKLVNEAKQDEAESNHTMKGPKAKKKAVLGQVGAGAGVVLNKQEVAVSGAKPAINRPLFPWEEGKYQAAGDISDADREKVEMLRAQLAELKSRVATKTPVENEGQEIMVKPVGGEQEPELPQAQPQNQNLNQAQPQNLDQNKDQGRQILSGEISIDDLKKQ